MSDDMFLSYRSLPSRRCKGVLSFCGETLFEFDEAEFRNILKKVAMYVREKHPDTLYFLRQDRPGLLPVDLGPEFLAFFKEDPVLGIRLLCPPDVTPKSIGARKPPIFMAGYDTLADSFGDQVYCKRNISGEVECPFCGRWCDGHFVIHCARCISTIPAVFTAHWALVEVSDLLMVDRPRYYLPRTWNTQGLWVSHEKLQQMYEQWLSKKEKIHVRFS